MNFIELGVSTLIAAMVGTLWRFMVATTKKQTEELRLSKKEREESEKLASEFRRSMQRAEIIRYFRIVVEQGKPISTEELSHLNSCYDSYHNDGGNGTGTVMYNKIIDNVKIVTIIGEDEDR